MTPITMVIFIILNRKGLLWLPRFYHQILMKGFLLTNLMFTLIPIHAVNQGDTYEKRMSPINRA